MATVDTANSRDAYTTHSNLRVEGGSSLGGLLKRAREGRGLTLRQIAHETRLPQRHLEALEQDNFAVVPSGFYQRAEIRAYARAVGLDQTALLAQLDSKPVETRRETGETTRARKSTSRLAYVPIGLVVVSVAVILFERALSPRAPTLEQVPDASVVTDSPPKSQSPVSDDSPQRAILQRDSGQPVVRASTLSAGAVPASTEPRGEAAVSATPVTTDTAASQPSADGVTELVVTTEPAGARVTVNGIAWGVTPVTIRHLPPGDKRIRVTKEGYAAEDRVLRIEERRSHALDVPLASTP